MKKTAKKITASFLSIAILVTSSGMQNLNVRAAGADKYISDMKLYIGTKSDAKKTFTDYEFVNTPLNGVSDGSDSVYLGIKRTSDKKDAIRDIAFMQMGGKYSISDYEKVLEDNKELARITVEEYKNVVEEYRANYNSTNPDKKKLADQAYELLNKYYEDDTKLHMGDFFLNSDGKVTDENYVTLAMQAPSTTLYALLNILTKGIDTDANSTWIDRLVSYNGFEGLCTANGFDANNNSAKKQAANHFEALYGDKIKYLTEAVESKKDGETVSISAWDEFAENLEKYADSLKETTDDLIESATDSNDPKESKEIAETIDENIDNDQAFIYSAIYELLTKVQYKDGTLYDLFATPSSEMRPEDFYPIIAALSQGQQTIMIHSGFQILISSIAEQVAASKELVSTVDINEEEIKENMDASAEELQKDNFKEQEQNIDEIIEQVCDEADKDTLEDIIKDDAVSVYAGVDRGFFEKGVAMTSQANANESGADEKWDVKKTLQIISYVSGGIGLTCVVTGAFLISAGNKAASSAIAEFEAVNAASYFEATDVLAGGIDESMLFTDADDLIEAQNSLSKLQSGAKAAAQEASAAYSIAGKVLVGIGLVLVAYSITAQILTLLKKDDVHYTLIPKKMVDASNKDKTEMESFLYYNAILNNKDEAQDLNNWKSEKWFAMYASKTKDSGKPILADSIKIQDNADGTAGMGCAHLFAEKGAQNLIQYKKGNKSAKTLFMYYNQDSSDNTASVFGKTTILASEILIALAVVVITLRVVYKKRKYGSEE